MKKEEKIPDPLTSSLTAGETLRRKAEKIYLEKAPLENIDNLPLADVKQMLHELRVHQIELEMQNEELREAQEELETSRARYFDLYDFAPVGYITVSEQGIILEANLTAATLLGESRSKLVKRPISGFILKEDQDIYYLSHKNLFESGKPQECKLRMVKKAGLPFWARLDTITVKDANGEPTCRMVVCDMTEQKQMEAKILHIQKVESLGRMAGAIAHHFNNQLSVVMGNLELVMNDLPDDGKNRKELLRSMMAAQKVAVVSQQMLCYLGQTSGKNKPIKLSEACRPTISLLQETIPKGMILNVNFPDSGPVIHSNAGQIQQVLTNLITNAWESISENQGTIGLTIRTVVHGDIPTSRRIPFDWQPQHIPHACLEVSDTGCGISNEDIDKLFDPFFTKNFTGRGMGLSVVLGIVKTHGGGITVDSEPGCGSLFRIYLPISTEIPPRQQEKPAAPAQKVEKGGTLLLIEDDEMVRKMAKTMLIRLGYMVIEAQDGIEAVEIFKQRQNEICCVLSDLTMPRMDGWETLTQLRRMRADVPVILISGYDKAKVMEGDHPELPQVFLNKPYRMIELKEALAKAMNI